MGTGQSTTLDRCHGGASGHHTFAVENAKELKAFMVRLNDTAEFVARRHWLDAKHRVNAPAEAPKPAATADEEAEERAMWLPFQHILVANHYLNDDALMQPLAESQFYQPRRESLGDDVDADGELDATDDEADDAADRGRLVSTGGGHGERPVIPLSAIAILSRNMILQSLDLGFNNLTSAIMKPLVSALRSTTQLRTLSLAGNAIGKPGCVELGAYLATNPSLERLSLFQCGLCDDDLVPLLQGLANSAYAVSPTARNSATLRATSTVSSRRSTGTEGTAAGGNTRLRYLNVDFNALTDLSVRRFLYLVYCDASRRSSGQSSSTTTTTTDTREAVTAAQTEADNSVTCVGTGNSGLAVILYESCPHDPTTMRVLDPFVYMSGRRLEYACTPTGYFRSGCDYRPEDLASSAVTGTTNTTGHSSSVKPSSGNPTVDSAGTLPPPPYPTLPLISLQPGQPRSSLHSTVNNNNNNNDDVTAGDPLPSDVSPLGVFNISENIYYDGTFVEEELAVATEEQRKDAARERSRLRKAMLREDFAGLCPFDPFLRRHLSVLLVKRRLAYEQELRQQRRALIEKVVNDTAAARQAARDGASALPPVVASPTSQGLGGSVQWHVAPNAAADDDDDDDEEEENEKEEDATDEAVRRASNRRHVSGLPRGDRAASHVNRGARTGSWKRLGGSLVRPGPPPLQSPERLEMVWRDAQTFRDTHTRPGTRTKSGLDYIVAPNGFDKVLLAASAHGTGPEASATIPRDRRRNQIVSEPRENDLVACWCDPQDASLLYGGSLHYHCVRERAVVYGNTSKAFDEDGDAAVGGDADRHGTKGAAGALGQRKSKSNTGPASRVSPAAAAAAAPTTQSGGGGDAMDVQKASALTQQRKLAYRGCQGTGHRCLSRQCADARHGAAAKQGRLPSLATSTQGQTTTTAQLATAAGNDRQERTVHTNQSGMTVMLSYNPSVYFSSAYVPSAEIIDECGA